MTPEEQMRQDIRDIKLAVIGDENIGTTGLVKRMKAVERRQNRFELRAAMFFGALAALWEGLKLWFENKRQ